MRALAFLFFTILIAGMLAGCASPLSTPNETEVADKNLHFYEFYSPM